MITLLMLCWVGVALSAPSWYWWCWGIGMFISIIKFGFDMYKAGSK